MCRNDKGTFFFFFFFQGIYSLGGDSRQNAMKYTSAVKLRHTKGLVAEVEGGLSHCKA